MVKNIINSYFMTDFVDNLLGSSTAGLIARFICHPIDTAKSRLQSGYKEFSTKGTFSTIASTVKSEGVRGLYRGFGAVLVGGTPGVCLYLSSYEYSKALLSEKLPQDSYKPVVYLASGMIAEILSCIVFVPVDIVKERLQVLSVTSKARPGYSSSWSTLKTVVVEEGVRGIYKGYGATLLSYGPFSALYFVSYEKIKSYWLQYGYDKSNANRSSSTRSSSSSSSSSSSKVGDIDFIGSLVCSAIAGAIASFITSPLDLAKLRLQIDRSEFSARAASASASASASTSPSFSPSPSTVVAVPGSADAFITKAAWQSSSASSAAASAAAYESAIKTAASSSTSPSLSPSVSTATAAASVSTSATTQPPLKSLFQALQRVYSQSGFRGLFRGSAARILFHTPSTALTMALFETCTKMWSEVLH